MTAEATYVSDHAERRLGERVAALEANQNNIADTLQETVKELKSIALMLAQQKGSEKVVFSIGGFVLAVLGGIANHFLK